MELPLWKILILAVVQGMTEFLPISSSGHAVLTAALLTPGASVGDEIADLNIVLHGGTLIAILVFYWHRVMRLLGEDRRTIGLLIVGTLPAVVAGVPLKIWGEHLLASPLLAGFLLTVTGVLLLSGRSGMRGTTTYQQLSYAHTIWIGVSQAIAILPGLSRSGTTILAGLRVGLDPQSAATFSFLLAIPAIGGACVLELAGPLSGDALQTPVSSLMAGALVSALVGWVSLQWLVRWIERGKLHYFAWWCIPVGAVVMFWQLSLRFAAQ